MLGCYIGSPTVAAKGVPEQFLTGIKAEKKSEKDQAETTGKEKPAATASEPMEVDKA